MAKTTAKCKGLCKQTYPVKMMKKIESPGHNYFFVCPDCATREESYYDENDKLSHREKKHGFTVSYEVETGTRNVASNLFYEYGFLPTEDGSICGTEWKTPIYVSFNGIKQLLRSVEKVGLFTNDEGCHTNIGNKKLTPEMIKEIRYSHIALFKPLSDYMLKNPEDVKRIFGRNFKYYAQAYRIDSNPLQHELFINLQHSTHIEFRICKFVTANQLFNATMLCREIVGCIITNYLDYLVDSSDDVLRRKLSVTSNKLISLFQKYAKKSV